MGTLLGHYRLKLTPNNAIMSFLDTLGADNEKQKMGTFSFTNV